MIKEGQAVKKGDLLFKFVPVLLQARMDAEMAEVQIAELEFDTPRGSSIRRRSPRMRSGSREPAGEGEGQGRSWRRPRWASPKSRRPSTA